MHLCSSSSTFQKLHSRFKPTTTTVSNRNSQASSITSAQAKFASFFQHHPVTSMSFSGDSNSLAVSCGNDVILCDSSTWLPVAETTTDTSFDKIQIKNDEMVGQVVYSPDSSILAITTALTSNGSGCRLVLYAQSEKGDGTSEWKVRETRSVSSKGKKGDTPLHLDYQYYHVCLMCTVFHRSFSGAIHRFLSDKPTPCRN